ncbi:MAG: NHLP family bacteriocin export ABC transporter peptidase/permease/ATPase subunit [Lachnospiraceae bacterium]|nr:NHLP family bacteriocin export ABC transporter peptidase/permease/ATPase subunit [Lachnospiraceae bacterium]
MKKVKIKQPVTSGVARVPIVMQLESLECGAACLAMILAYYEKWIPLERARADCGVSRDGSNAKNILKAARSHGLNAKAYRYEPETLKESGHFPCIIHWNFNHFVVLNGFKKDKAVLNDPARGTYSVSMETFDESFTGICLMFEPSENFEPGGRPKSILRFAKSRLEGTGSAVAFVVLATAISALIGVIKPGFSRIFLDRLLTGQNPDWLYPFVIGLSLLAAVELLVSFININVSNKIDGKMAAYGNTSFMWKVLRMPMEFFSQRMAGDIQQRQESNASIAGTLVNTFAPLILNAVMLVFYLVVMIRYSPLLTAVGVGSILIKIVVSQVVSRMRVNISRVKMRYKGKLAGATVAGIEMIETIKASGAENGYFEQWAGYQAGVNTQSVRNLKLKQYLWIVKKMVSSLADIAVLSIGVFLTMQGEFTIGMILAFQGYLSSFLSPVNDMIDAGESIQEMRTEMERVEDVMQYPTDVNYENEDGNAENKEYDKLSGRVEMRNVTFGYSRMGEPLIENFNLTLEPGSRVAFVGSSGCGKSTLSKLISGLYKPWSGEILFDGKPISEIDHSVFTGSLAVVDQDIILFEDTIANNIKMWDNSIEDFEMIMAARDAQLHEDIMQRDGGYQYKITEGGKDFSGGQRQRMEIARVLAQDPTIIIMDEATSALDARTEYQVVQSICERGISCIVVAHRLSTIRDCDEIIVLDHGKVAERGTHEELYAKGGIYTQLVSNE